MSRRTIAPALLLILSAGNVFAQYLPHPRPVPPVRVPPVAVPVPNPIPRPVDPSYDPLAYQRGQIRAQAQQLAYTANQFLSLARSYAQTRQVVGDGYYGRRIVLVTDPAQAQALATATRLTNAAAEFVAFQNQFLNCGIYERERYLCDRTLGRELSLLQTLRFQLQQFRMSAGQLRATRIPQGLQLLQQIQVSAQVLIQTYRQAGLLRVTPMPRPLPQPGPVVPRPHPGPVPAPSPDPSGNLAQAQALAEQTAAHARQAQGQAAPYRDELQNAQAIELIDGFVAAAENLVVQVRSRDLALIRSALQQTQVELSSARASVQVALQSSNNLAAADQSLAAAEQSLAQLAQLVGAN